MPYSGFNVISGPGTLYAAPLGTTEPVSATGAWAAGWTQLGYTAQGSQFHVKPSVSPVMVEETYWPVRNAFTAMEAHITFNLAEMTFQNWMLALNSGIGTSQLTGTSGTNPDGSKWVEAADVGQEVRVMLGWDSLSPAATSEGTVSGRLIVRQAVQVGQVQVSRRKGATIAEIACDFQLEKPPGVMPFRHIIPASMLV